jgi:L-alanine-DL-glutamate epimerase-like enolase superfamily enzyme
MFINEQVPENGTIFPSDEPGWGLKLNRDHLNLFRPFNTEI